MSADLLTVAQFAVFALAGMGLLFLLTSKLRSPQPKLHKRSKSAEALVLLFEKGALIDTNTDASKFLGNADFRFVDWQLLHGVFSSHINTLPPILGDAQNPYTLYPKDAKPSDVQALIEQMGHRTRVSIFNWPNLHSRDSEVSVPMSEFEALTNATMDSPFPIWRRSITGHINWANPAFFRECGRWQKNAKEGHRLLFDIPKGLRSGDSFDASFFSEAHKRQEHFFVSMVSNGKAQMFFASKTNKIVEAQTQRANFIQTLSKTFAQLSVGLAIFDQNKRLVLFNPALADIFSLQTEMLVGTPTMKQFFDRLREKRMIPEPKNYGTWREKLMRMVVDATDDCYEELWPLPSGATIRATGRPHKDGAIAFLFENISPEIDLERRYKADHDLMSAVIDTRPEAIAVLSLTGQFVLTNQSFREMWGIEPDLSLSVFTWQDFKPFWIEQTQDSQIFLGVRNYLHLTEHRQPFARRASLKSGRGLHLSVQPIAAGQSVLSFALEPKVADRAAQKVPS